MRLTGTKLSWGPRGRTGNGLPAYSNGRGLAGRGPRLPGGGAAGGLGAAGGRRARGGRGDTGLSQGFWPEAGGEGLGGDRLAARIRGHERDLPPADDLHRGDR